MTKEVLVDFTNLPILKAYEKAIQTMQQIKLTIPVPPKTLKDVVKRFPRAFDKCVKARQLMRRTQFFDHVTRVVDMMALRGILSNNTEILPEGVSYDLVGFLDRTILCAALRFIKHDHESSTVKSLRVYIKTK